MLAIFYERTSIEAFNYYIQNSYATFLQQPVPDAFFEQMLKLLGSFPSVSIRKDGDLVGFGMLRPHSPMPAFAHTAEITYFINPSKIGPAVKVYTFVIISGVVIISSIPTSNIERELALTIKVELSFRIRYSFISKDCSIVS